MTRKIIFLSLVCLSTISYSDNTNKLIERKADVIYDYKNKLAWQDNSDVSENNRAYVIEENYKKNKFLNYEGKTAINYCKDLRLNGKDDWRLPTYKELSVLIGKKGYGKDLVSNIKYTADIFWSSTISSFGDNVQMGIDTVNKATSHSLKDFKFVNIRCIRNILKGEE